MIFQFTYRGQTVNIEPLSGSDGKPWLSTTVNGQPVCMIRWTEGSIDDAKAQARVWVDGALRMPPVTLRVDAIADMYRRERR